jgi:hypothetical protein
MYGRSFIAVAGNGFEMSVSCACCLSEVCGVYSKLARISFILVYGKLTALVGRFLVQKRPSRLDFIDKIIDTSYAWNNVPRKFYNIFPDTF